MRALGWTPGGDVSLGETLVDRHATSGRSALSWFGVDGSHRAYTFAELGRLSKRFANLLAALGVDRGDRVAGYLPRVPETLVDHARRVEGGRDLRADLHRLRPRRDRVPHGA